MSLERPAAFAVDLRHLLGSFRGVYVVNAIVGFIFAASAPVAIILTASARGGLSQSDVESWLFGCFVVNGVISMIFCLAYRQPLVFFWTIPGTILVGQALDHLSLAEVVGAYFATGALMFVLGLSGWVRTCMSRLPMPIVMAMVAGVFLQFGLDLVFAIRDGVMIAAPMTVAFVALSAWARIGRLMPPLIGALIVGVAAIALSGTFDPQGLAALTVARPNLHMPAFSWAAMAELVLPLAITVLAAQNAQGFVILEAAGHKPPVNAVTAACGLGSLIAALFGTVSTCLTGPVNAIISSAGDRDRHYAAGVMVSLLALLFGLFAPVFTRVMLATPKVFIATLAGLALLRVLERAFVVSFSGAFTLGATVTFLVTVANVRIFSIGAPFWAVIVGLAVSWALERKDFDKLAAGQGR
ncbi:benzoate/H(+) symporter BenE family transporter [Reyranella sp.]|uniref:benzoate/H(+) symporter BenE family transporter n=1 Tax=Reyranella sp. TaxID=1929291 RepID=UPI003BABA08A